MPFSLFSSLQQSWLSHLVSNSSFSGTLSHKFQLKLSLDQSWLNVFLSGDNKKCPYFVRNLQYKINLSQSLRHIVIFASTLLNTYIGLSGTMTCAALPQYNSDECASNSTLSSSVRSTSNNTTTAVPLSTFTTTSSLPTLETDYDNTICQSPQVCNTGCTVQLVPIV